MAKIVFLLNRESSSFPSEESVAREWFAETSADPSTYSVVAEAGADLGAELTRALADDEVRRVVVGGGDGAVNHAAQTMAGGEKELGVVPLGNFNNFAGALGVPDDPREAIRVAFEGRARKVDCAEVNGVRFVNNASVGVYPEIVKEREREAYRGRVEKRLATVAAAWRALRNSPMIKARISDGERRVKVRSPIVFVGNNRYRLDPLGFGSRERLDGGTLDARALRTRNPWRLLRSAIAAADGRVKPLVKYVALEGAEIVVDFKRRERILVALDGELADLDPPLRFRSLPKSLTVIAP
jgi:diacylglycerol kinase family enzyme